MSDYYSHPNDEIIPEKGSAFLTVFVTLDIHRGKRVKFTEFYMK
jgi:hypothetical protein